VLDERGRDRAEEVRVEEGLSERKILLAKRRGQVTQLIPSYFFVRDHDTAVSLFGHVKAFSDSSQFAEVKVGTHLIYDVVFSARRLNFQVRERSARISGHSSIDSVSDVGDD
jgi:hypothetical protein